MDCKQSQLAKSLWNDRAVSYKNQFIDSGTEYLIDIVKIIERIAESKYSELTFPATSHESLIIKTHLGIDNDRPFLGVSITPEGKFDFILWSKIGRKRGTSSCQGFQNAWKILKELIEDLILLDQTEIKEEH